MILTQLEASASLHGVFNFLCRNKQWGNKNPVCFTNETTLFPFKSPTHTDHLLIQRRTECFNESGGVDTEHRVHTEAHVMRQKAAKTTSPTPHPSFSTEL